MAYECADCEGLHLQPVDECVYCGHPIVRESVAGIEARTGLKPMEFGSKPSASTAKESASSVWDSPDVNPDGSIASGGVETPEPVQRSRWESFSLEKWRIKITGNVRYMIQIVGVALVLLTAYNLLVYPFVGIGIWFGHRDILVGAIVANGGNEFGLYVISDLVVMVVGMIAAWFA